MHMKKILYVITKSNFGGAQRYVYELACAMHDVGHTVAVAHGGEGVLKDMLEAHGIQTFPIKNFDRDINVIKEWRAFFELLSILKEFKPDIVHLNSSKAGGTGALAARMRGVEQIIFTAHGWAHFEDRSLLWRSIVRLLSFLTVLLCHRVIAVSKNDYEHADIPFSEKKFRLIHTAVSDISFFSRAQAREALFDEETIHAHLGHAWLVSIAELTSNKNLHSAIDAVIEHNSTCAQQIFYTIIGGGELWETLHMYVRERGAEAYVHFAGQVQDARTYLQAFDLFILPSLKEGMPYVLLEAGYAELPVIAASRGGIPEVIEHERSGLLIDPTDIAQIHTALDRLVNNPELRIAYANALHARVEKEYALADMIQATSAVYFEGD